MGQFADPRQMREVGGDGRTQQVICRRIDDDNPHPLEKSCAQVVESDWLFT